MNTKYYHGGGGGGGGNRDLVKKNYAQGLGIV